MFNRISSVFLMTSLLLISAQVYAESPQHLVNKGNRAFARQKYDKALEAYEKAAVDLPESAHIYFNKGAAYYRKEDFAKATDAFVQAALKSKSTKLEAKCKFNLGLCSFREADRQKDSDLDKALEACGKSIGHFQEALKLDPDFIEAAENIEVVRLTMKSILDEVNKKKEDAQKQQEAMKKIAEQIKKLVEKQQELLDRNKYLSEEKEQKGDSPDLQNKISDMTKDQNDLTQKTMDTSKKLPSALNSSNPPPAMSDPVKKHLENAASEQKSALEKLEKSLTAPAQSNQQKALDELKKALESLGKGQNQNEGNKGEKQGQNPKDSNKGGKNKQKEAQPAAINKQQEKKEGEKPKAQIAQLPDNPQQILDEERKNKNARNMHQAGGFSEVDKDW